MVETNLKPSREEGFIVKKDIGDILNCIKVLERFVKSLSYKGNEFKLEDIDMHMHLI